MKRRLILSLAVGCVLLLLASVILAAAQMAGYSLLWWTADGGGGDSSGGGYQLSGTVGQPDAGVLAGRGYRLEGGFWGGTGGVTALQQVFLPVALRP